MVANQTSQNYVERAIGRDVILIGHVNVSRQYVNFLSQFFEAKEMETISYLEPEYAISENLISKLNSTPGVLEVDPRLVLETRVFEVPGVTIDPEEPGNYIPVGDHRSSEALVLGIDPRRAINEWLVSGRVLNESDSDFALIGDSLASKIFALPMKQRVNIFKRKFAIVGVCLDPLNNGVVVYVPLKTLSTLVGESNYNLLLVSIDPSNRLEVIAELKDKVSETLGSEFEVFQLNATLEKHKGFLGHIWSLVMFLPLFSLVTATLCLLSYTMLSITGQQRELGIMRALGAKPKTIAKIILLETCLIVLISGASGIFAGFFVTWFFLLPEAVVSTATLLSVMGWLLLALVFISLTSIYPALRIVKAPIARTISQP